MRFIYPRGKSSLLAPWRLLLAASLFGSLAADGAAPPSPDQAEEDERASATPAGNKPERLEDFRDLALGMFIHW